jgi:hypothetical protein
MRIVFILILFFLILLGVFLGIKSFNDSKAIFWGVERRVIAAITNAALGGLSSTLTVFGAVYFLASVTDPKYPLVIIDLLKGFLFFSVIGFIIFLGSLWQFFFVGLYREPMMKFFIHRANKKQ